MTSTNSSGSGSLLSSITAPVDGFFRKLMSSSGTKGSSRRNGGSTATAFPPPPLEPPRRTAATIGPSQASPAHIASLERLLQAAVVDPAQLRKECWRGVPSRPLRFAAWALMLGYYPPAAATRVAVVRRKRAEYMAWVHQHHTLIAWDDLLLQQQGGGSIGGGGAGRILQSSSSGGGAAVGASSSGGGAMGLPGNRGAPTGAVGASTNLASSGAAASATGAFLSGSASLNHSTSFDVNTEDLATMRQIRKDVPRTVGGVAMLQDARTQLLLERVLYLWAIRHPASGYVQGMNDILLPFLFCVVADRLDTDADVGRLVQLDAAAWRTVRGTVADADWDEMEADTYWLLTAFLSIVQGNFTFTQSGTHTLTEKLEVVVRLVDPALSAHLRAVGVKFAEFAFRWMNCFMVRELPYAAAVRLFDTYCAEDQAFASFHVYVCAVYLGRLAPRLKAADDMADVIPLLHAPSAMTEEEVAELTSQAYLLQQLYGSRVEALCASQESAALHR